MKTAIIRYKYDVYLPNEEEHQRYKNEATKRGIGVSQMIREAVYEYLSKKAGN